MKYKLSEVFESWNDAKAYACDVSYPHGHAWIYECLGGFFVMNSENVDDYQPDYVTEFMDGEEQ
jgi:hypothetical protein